MLFSLHRLTLPSPSIARGFYSLTASLLFPLLAGDLHAATYLVSWQAEDFSYHGADYGGEVEIEAPFAAVSGTFVLTLDTDVQVDPTAQGIGGFDMTIPFGSEPLYIYSFSPGYFDSLYLAGAENGINSFGEDDYALLISDFLAEPIFEFFSYTTFHPDAMEVLRFTSWTGSATVTEFTDAPSPVPVPASVFVLIGGLGGLAAIRRRRQTAA